MIKKGNVSVIIPCWNSEATIKRAIRSVQRQTLLPLEILVCDDGSTDKTTSIVRSINSPLIKWNENKSHSGKPAVPRNRGIKLAKGKWIAFLDADDEWLPNKLQKEYSAAIHAKSPAVCSNAFRIKEGYKKSLFFHTKQRDLTLTNLFKTNSIICSSMFVHRSLFKSAIGFPEDKKLISIEDYALWLRIAAQTKILYLNDPLVIYYDNPQISIRSKVNINPLLLKILVIKNFLFWLAKNHEHFTYR